MLSRTTAHLRVRQISRSAHTVPLADNFINGKFVPSKATYWIDVRNPATQEVYYNLMKFQSFHDK